MTLCLRAFAPTETINFDTLSSNLFGPQSQWSSLLAQREHLVREIQRGKRYLEQLRKDVASWGMLFETSPKPAGHIGEDWRVDVDFSPFGADAMEQFLLRWLERLEERHGQVSRLIDTIPAKNRTVEVEDPMFQLLRAAG